MDRRHILAVLAASLLLAAPVTASAGSRDREYRQAVRLYQNGMYQSARALFEAASRESGDVLSEGYAVLCAAKMHTEGYQSLVAQYLDRHPESILSGQLHYELGLDYFDRSDYQSAKNEFMKFSKDALLKEQLAEFMFKRAYCDFGLNEYEDARSLFTAVEKMPFSDYTAPSRYAIGYIDYSDNRFESAEEWFLLSARDPRFKEHSEYYILECRFMDKDYSYVVKNGPDMYELIPEERKPHLARIISESYLVLGDTEKAREYFEKNSVSSEKKNRADYFYAGSLLYATKDYAAAIENFNRMGALTDSLGQIASYELGNAYLQTKNKVAAMEAFKQASSLSFDPVIQEDATFNHAKLAFDLNQDGSVFTHYIDKYAKSKRGDDIYGYMALTKLVSHDYAGAVEAYDRIDDLSQDMRSNYMKANYLRANQLIANGSWRDAIPCLQASAFYTGRRDPFNQLSRYWLAESYFHSGKFAEAEKIYVDLYNTSALERRPEGRNVAYNLAYSYFSQEDYANASKWFDTYVSAAAGDFLKDAAVRRADCDFASKDYKAAAVSYEAVLERYSDPDDVYPYYQLGLVYGLTGDNKKKITALSRVNEASPSSLLYPEAMYELGRAYVATKNNAEAQKCFETLSLNSRDATFVARSLIELGMLSRNASQNDKALEYYKKVVEELPRSEFTEDALVAIESIYQAKGEPESYIAYMEESGAGGGKTEAEKEEIYFNSAEQVFVSGNYQKALAAVEKYLEAYPSGARATEAYYYAAESYKYLGQKENAADFYAKVLSRSDVPVLMEASALNFAELSYGLEHYADAYNGYSRLREVAKISDNVTAAMAGMMRSAYRAKDFNGAIAACGTLLADGSAGAALVREADYIKAKSLLAGSLRAEAFEILARLAANPSTDEGAEAAYMLIQDTCDKGDFDKVEDMVYDFSSKAAGQNYWLAKAFIVLGDSFAEQDNFPQAKATFESIQSGYEPQGPEDDVLDNVKMRLEKLSKLM